MGGKGRRGKGKRPGKGGHGKGKGSRAKGKGLRKPGARTFAGPASVGHAGPLPDDPVAPFLHPAARPLVQVPLEFSSLRHWCDVIGNNILAEFWYMFREARASWSGFGGAAGDELMVDNAPAEGLSQCLLLIDRQPRIAAAQRVLGVGKVAVKLRGGAARSGQVKSLGYIGSFLAEFAAALELRNLQPKDMTAPMRAILEPKVDLPGDYARRKVNAALVPVNPSQRAAIEGLQFALEKIQGPPGTGKSTTIFHILDARLPAGQRVLVTCSRNVAVESIAQKLEGLEDWPLCVFGPRDRVGETARRYLLDSQVGGHLDERRRGKVKSLAQQRGQELREAIAQREARLKGCRRQRFLLGFLKKRHAAAYALRDFCTRLDEYCAKVAAAPKWWEQQAKESKEAVLASARVFLCTIASSSRMLREWEEAMGSELRVHTVIVDECGCTPESSTALLLRIRPSNLVLVGDHKQLPPTSLVQPQLLEGTGHNRSLLERCVLASGRVHQLREQYRMHPSIASVVSGLFYAGRLLTPLSVAQERKAQEPRPLVWMDVQGRDEAPNKSYVNFSEVSACVRVVARIRERVGPGPSVALLTFYKGQLEELMKALPSNLDAEVLTVDACQGSEFDFVILSTVRANREQRLGFVKDAQRICVAASRSRMQLFIVGHRQTLASDGDWRKVAEACLPPKPDEVQPQRPLPASFVSVFDALRKAKEKEAEQKALQAMEEQDAKGRGKSRSPGVSYYGAESLMRQQGSFRGAKTLTRRKDGSYASGSVVAIGGGFRSRRDVQELENLAKAHLQSMEAPRPEQSAYRMPATSYQSEFPEISGPATLTLGSRVSMPKANLRPLTRNDEKRERRKALKAEAKERLESSPDEPEVAEVWEDVHEAVLFEMFPDDTEAVEDALRRFAGMPHQAARALEALLARPEPKAAEGEDDLDYDWQEDWAEGEEEEEEEEEQDPAAECAFCGEDAADGEVAEDGQLYCSRCWEEWAAPEPAPAPSPAPEQTKATVRRWGNTDKAKAAASNQATRTEHRREVGSAFFQSLDGAPQWEKAPDRPEAGGKELVALRPKEERGSEEPLQAKSRRAVLTMPKLAEKVQHEPQEPRCRRLLEEMKPALEESVLDYLSSLIGEADAEELEELRETILEILQGHGVAADTAESFLKQLRI